MFDAMIPTGEGKVGMKLKSPDGIGTVTAVHNQDNVTVELDGLKNPRTGKMQTWIGDVAECDAFCEDCKEYHTHEKHSMKKEKVNA